MANSQPDFKTAQFNFTAHIRDPDNAPVPDGIEARRMKIYSELFYNNIEGFISSAFPVLKTLYSDTNWHKMVRDFFINYRCQTPLFLEIAEEFIHYLQQHKTPQPEDPPFLLELAHYEWVELALMIADETAFEGKIDPNADLLKTHPALSSLAWPLAYQYPVHQISKDFQPQSISETPNYLVVYRTRTDDIEFLEVNPVTARLLQLINENDELTGFQALQQIAEELNTDNSQLIIENGLVALQQLQQEGIITGGVII